MLKLGPHEFCVTPTINTGSTTTVASFPDSTKPSKKQRIAELEARVAQLESDLARRPLVTYTDGKPWWAINPLPPTYVGAF